MDEFNLLQNLHLCTLTSVCETSSRPFGEVSSTTIIANTSLKLKIKPFYKHNSWSFFFTCVALAKAGLVVGPLRPVSPSVVCPSVCPSGRNTLGCQICVIYNSKSFHSFLFKLCLMIVHILKMCTFYIVHVS